MKETIVKAGIDRVDEPEFARLFAGPGGSDPYGALCGELYSSAFGSGGFAGKGILDAEMLLRCGEKLPTGRILSHDALEGAYLHGAYMSDAAFSDAFPAKPLAYFKRLHRWVRGDWQNAPWIFKGELSIMDRFRLLDSLRRSLVAPLTLTALLAAGIHTGRDVLVITLANKGNMPLHPYPIDLLLYDPAHDADTIADALIAYLDTGAAPGTIALENTFVAGDSSR